MTLSSHHFATITRQPCQFCGVWFCALWRVLSCFTLSRCFDSDVRTNRKFIVTAKFLRSLWKAIPADCCESSSFAWPVAAIADARARVWSELVRSISKAALTCYSPAVLLTLGPERSVTNQYNCVASLVSLAAVTLSHKFAHWNLMHTPKLWRKTNPTLNNFIATLPVSDKHRQRHLCCARNQRLVSWLFWSKFLSRVLVSDRHPLYDVLSRIKVARFASFLPSSINIESAR